MDCLMEWLIEDRWLIRSRSELHKYWAARRPETHRRSMERLQSTRTMGAPGFQKPIHHPLADRMNWDRHRRYCCRHFRFQQHQPTVLDKNFQRQEQCCRRHLRRDQTANLRNQGGFAESCHQKIQYPQRARFRESSVRQKWARRIPGRCWRFWMSNRQMTDC